jgi:hydrogenase nickel incorporation protein HypB
VTPLLARMSPITAARFFWRNCRADRLLLSKTDLLPHLRVDLRLMMDNALKINPRLQIFPVSAYSGDGLDVWYGWLRNALAEMAAGA